MSTTYVDRMGRTVPSDRIAGPGCLYVGNLHRGRVALSLSGQRMKVVSQNEGSTTVRITKPARTFSRPDGSVARIRAATDDLTIARGTIVRPLVDRGHVPERDTYPRADASDSDSTSSSAFARSGKPSGAYPTASADASASHVRNG